MHPFPLCDAAVAHFCVAESTSGDLAGVFCSRARRLWLRLPRPPFRTRHAAPNSEGPSRHVNRFGGARVRAVFLCLATHTGSHWRSKGRCHPLRAPAPCRRRVRNTGTARSRGPRVIRSRGPHRQHRTGPAGTARGASRAAF